MYHIFFIDSSVDGHVGCSHVLATVKSFAIQVTKAHLISFSVLSSVMVFCVSCLFKILTLLNNTQMSLRLVCFWVKCPSGWCAFGSNVPLVGVLWGSNVPLVGVLWGQMSLGLVCFGGRDTVAIILDLSVSSHSPCGCLITGDVDLGHLVNMVMTGM